MTGMFYGASAFNQLLVAWNVSLVTMMNGMFTRAVTFNQSIGSWNVAPSSAAFSKKTIRFLRIVHNSDKKA